MTKERPLNEKHVAPTLDSDWSIKISSVWFGGFNAPVFVWILLQLPRHWFNKNTVNYRNKIKCFSCWLTYTIITFSHYISAGC